MIEILTAEIKDIDTIHSLAHRIWPVAYSHIISQEQMKYMLEMMYSHDSLQYQIEDQQHKFIIAWENGSALGFAAWFPKYDISPALFRLDKLYVLHDQQGKGIGKKLIDHIIEDIKPQNASILELTVNRNNKAVDFYKNLGFQITSEVDTPIGEGYFMNDYVMSLTLQLPLHK